MSYHYIYVAGKKHRVMHIQKFSYTGVGLMRALCGINLPFDRTINAPFALGRKVCVNCIKVANKDPVVGSNP